MRKNTTKIAGKDMKKLKTKENVLYTFSLRYMKNNLMKLLTMAVMPIYYRQIWVSGQKVGCNKA
jgi:hypothetical protein